jgi:pilus assembly protein CpaB
MKLPSGSKYFILAGVVGLAAVFLVHRYISMQVSPKLAPTAQLVVAEVDIAPGMALTSRVLRVATWPKDIVPPKAAVNTKQVDGRVAQAPIAKGEPIIVSKLAPEGTAAGLGGLLEPNTLAVTVKTDEVSGVAGFVNPGDRIDVLAEMTSPGSSNEHFSKIILQNLKVLSKGQVWDQTADKKPQVVPTVTVQVTPEQAETLNLASFQGRIRLALRNQLNRKNFSTGGVVTSQLCNRLPAPDPVPAVPSKDSKPKRRIVQVIKGMNVSNTQL